MPTFFNQHRHDNNEKDELQGAEEVLSSNPGNAKSPWGTGFELQPPEIYAATVSSKTESSEFITGKTHVKFVVSFLGVKHLFFDSEFSLVVSF